MKRRTIKAALLLLSLSTVSFLLSCGFLAGKIPSFESTQESLKDIRLPAGFQIALYAEDVKGARSMALGKNGTLFVGTRGVGNVYAIVPSSAGGKPRVVTIAHDLNAPNGVAFKDGALYVAEVSRILRFDSIERLLDAPPKPVVVTTALPDKEGHEWKFMRFGLDGKLYFAVGVKCNICEEEDKRYGTIMRCNVDGSELEIYASGIRNTVGFDWDKSTKVLWFTENGRDWLGDDLPPDELNSAPRTGMNFGFPYCYGKGHADPEYKDKGRDCSQFTPAAMDLGPHVAALGMRFYTGSMFPEKYRNGIFIAEHGSWNRSKPIGYRVMFVRMEAEKPVSYEVFAEGWLGGAVAWGRPVDVEVMPDGSLLVSDDKAGAIYRISYK